MKNKDGFMLIELICTILVMGIILYIFYPSWDSNISNWDVYTPNKDKTCIKRTVVNQTVRQDLFEKCMKLLPVWPQKTHYNDWSEVVDICDKTAMRQSKVVICPKDQIEWNIYY